MFQKLIVLLNGLGKSESRVQYPVFDAESVRLLCKGFKVTLHFRHNSVRIICQSLHRVRSASLVHRDVRKPKFGNGGEHVRIILSC